MSENINIHSVEDDRNRRLKRPSLALKRFGTSENASYDRAMHILKMEPPFSGDATEQLSRAIRAGARLFDNPVGLDLDHFLFEDELQDVAIARDKISEVLSRAGYKAILS